MLQCHVQDIFLAGRGKRVSSVKTPLVARSTVADSWRWLWPDVLTRILPLGIAPFIYIAVLRLPPAYLGLTLNDWPQQVMIGFLIGIPMAGLAVLYRIMVVGPGFRWPTPGDHALQGFYYLFVNAPVEELFFRGFMLVAVAQWTGWIGWGWLVSTATYTLYHRLGDWSWRRVGGVGLAALVFSFLYLAQPSPRSLLAVVIVHGLASWGFLSLGDEVMYRMWKRRNT
jgi:membrane protease YdiL (CAAX protease family)